MSIDSLSAYKDRRDASFQRVMISKGTTVTVIGRSFSTWLAAGLPAAGSAPTTAVVPDRTTAGALSQVNSGGTQRILRVILSWASPGGMLTIADRLSHQGGLSGTSGSAQTTNLPTAGLTRQTTGVGVLAGLEIYTQIGATGTTVSVSYTNQAGTSGQVSPAATWGGTGFREASRLLLIPLASGDRGVRAVASVTAAGTTGTAGNFGVTLLYPLVTIPFNLDFGVEDQDVEALYGMGTWFPKVDTDACLFNVVHTANNASTGVIAGEIHIGEE